MSSSPPTEEEATASVKLKQPLQFTNSTDEIKAIASLTQFAYFWENLEIWVRAMLVECPEEYNDDWYQTWKGWEKFQFRDPTTSSSLISVCIMENTRDSFTILDILEQLSLRIPYLANHIYFTAGDAEAETAVIKLKMFQHYEYQNPFVNFSDPSNSYNNLQDDMDNEASVDVQQRKPSNVPTGDTNEDKKNPPEENPNDNSTSANQNNRSPDEFDGNTDTAQHKRSQDEFDDNGSSLLSFTTTSYEDVNTSTTRGRRKQQNIRTIIQNTCKAELASMQTNIISEVTKVLYEHITTVQQSAAVVNLPSETNNSGQQSGDRGKVPTPVNTPVNDVPDQQLTTNNPTPGITNTTTRLPASNPSNAQNRQKYPRRGPTPTQSFNRQRWNSQWKHRSNPNFSNSTPTQAQVQNPYASTRPPVQVQFAQPTATSIPNQQSPYRSHQSHFQPIQQNATPGVHNQPSFQPSASNQQLHGSTGQNVGGTHPGQFQTPGNQNQQQHSSHSNMPTSSTMNFNRPTANPTFHNQPQHGNIVKGGVVQFTYNGVPYELRDTDFTKYAGDLLHVQTTDDIIHFYKHLHSLAIQRNIFVTDFDQLFFWDRSAQPLPPTCIFTSISSSDNTELAYKRMRSVLYQKIVKATFARPEHQAIVTNYAITQDGFALLYDLAARCHPHLLAKSSRYNRFNVRPQMTPEDNIYTLKRKYETWLELERVSNRVYTDECVLRYVMKDLEDDTRYDKALQQLRVDLATHETMKRQMVTWVPFPVELMLHNLPQTVMSCYDDNEKDSLFSDATISKMSSASSTTTDTSSSESKIEEGFVRTVFATGDDQDIQAFINVMKRSNRLPARESINAFCKGCGKFGHDIYHQGCDFCAQLSIALKFLEKHPEDVKKVICDYMAHQKKRAANKPSNGDRKDRTPRFNRQRNMKATVKSISTAIESALQNLVDTSDSENEDVFEDAQDEESAGSTSVRN